MHPRQMLEKITNYFCADYTVSATSNKSKLLIFLMIAISLVFFVASFIAASVASEQAASTGELPANLANCITAITGERAFVDCSVP